jgi:hypothetical protein
LQEFSLELGSVLQVPDKPIEYVYFPHQGMISLLAVMSDGQGIETATVGSEGVVGAMSGFGIRAGVLRGRWSRPPWWPATFPVRTFRQPFRIVKPSNI